MQKTTFAILLFLFLGLAQTFSQVKSEEILTITVDWADGLSNTHKIYINQPGEETIIKTIKGQISTDDYLSKVTKEFNEILNSYAALGWKLQSTYVISEEKGLNGFIFRREK